MASSTDFVKNANPEADTNFKLPDLVVHGFTDGQTYDKNRPNYTEDSVALVVEMLLKDVKSCNDEDNDDAISVLELGAGTGKLTQILSQALPQNECFLASEPMDDFFKTLQKNCPQLCCRIFPAENIQLPDHSVKGIVCGQCFHWFRPEALREIHRVLLPRGNLVLIWNTKDRRVQWLDRVLTHYLQYNQPGDACFYDFSWKRELDESPLFALQSIHDCLPYPHQEMTRAAFLQHLKSISVLQRMESEKQARVLGEICQILDSYPESKDPNLLTLPMYTEIYHYKAVE